jgi:hypothetical protein
MRRETSPRPFAGAYGEAQMTNANPVAFEPVVFS